MLGESNRAPVDITEEGQAADAGVLDCTRARAQVSFEGVEFYDSVHYAVHVLRSQAVALLNCSIWGDPLIPASSGVVIDGSRRVYLGDCTISTADNAVGLKTTEGLPPFEHEPGVVAVGLWVPATGTGLDTCRELVEEWPACVTLHTANRTAASWWVRGGLLWHFDGVQPRDMLGSWQCTCAGVSTCDTTPLCSWHCAPGTKA